MSQARKGTRGICEDLRRVAGELLRCARDCATRLGSPPGVAHDRFAAILGAEYQMDVVPGKCVSHDSPRRGLILSRDRHPRFHGGLRSFVPVGTG
jgi:hypothetical protein